MAAPLLPQPDFHQLNQNLAGVFEQIGRIQNMPSVVGVEALVVNMREQHDQALAQQAQQHAATLAQQAQQHAAALAQQAQQQAVVLAQQAQQHQEVIERLDSLQEGQRRLPMQLQNAIASLDAPLQYPPTVNVGHQFPRTKRDLLRLTAANAQVVSQALGLPALPANTLVAARQQQIIDFLGCALRA
ncbi:hypothetical protein AX15_005214 [Amanita polypyramis BW_CC]|nr:hypothetical protein AX15_005214 [Amanita polypyramis BW_CC]